MADKKISQLIVRTADGTEYTEVIIPPFGPGDNRRVLLSQLLSIATGGTWGSITGTLSAQTDLQSALDAKAPLASPTFTGTPAAPTAAGGTNTTQIATTAFVQAAMLSSATPSTTGGTITLDMNSQQQRMHVGSASFSSAKIIAMSNATNALQFQFIFEVTNVAAVLTVPSDWLMSSANFNGTDWTPPGTGRYVFGGMFDGTNWYVNDGGPYV
jgi:hypothetical protein